MQSAGTLSAETYVYDGSLVMTGSFGENMTAAAARARSVPNQVYVGAAPGRGDAGHRLIAQASTRALGPAHRK